MRSLISIDFPAPEMEPEAHMWYQLSPFPSSNVAICDAATPRQTFTNPSLLRATPLLRAMF